MDGFSLKVFAKLLPVTADKPIAVIHSETARELGVMPLDRIMITDPKTKKSSIAIIDITDSLVSEKEIGLFKDVQKAIKTKDASELCVTAVERPKSVDFIKNKILGQPLKTSEIKEIVKDLDQNRLSDVEAGAFMSAVYIHGYNMQETLAMARALLKNGKRVTFDVKPIVDKHSIGGINGRATMVIVPIVAAAGLYFPKNSSRSITSAAGTADSMEVLANVALDIEEIKKITKKTGAVISWGGALNLAPVDEKIIKIEYPLSLNPQGQIIASVLAKKASVSSSHVVIDLPIGNGLKLSSKEEAEILAEKFIEIGSKLGMKIEAVVTDGNKPSGPAFGPALEAKHALQVLEGKTFDELAQKSCELSGVLLEMTGKAKEGEGFETARKILRAGKANKKMKEIIKAQQGKIFKSEKITHAEFKAEIKSRKEGEIMRIDIKRLTLIARAAGAPYDKKAGVLLKKETGKRIKKHETIYEIHAENKRKLENALKLAKQANGIELSRIILKKICK